MTWTLTHYGWVWRSLRQSEQCREQGCLCFQRRTNAGHHFFCISFPMGVVSPPRRRGDSGHTVVKGAHGSTDANPICAAMSKVFNALLQKELGGIRINRSDPSRHANLTSNLAADRSVLMLLSCCSTIEGTKPLCSSLYMRVCVGGWRPLTQSASTGEKGDSADLNSGYPGCSVGASGCWEMISRFWGAASEFEK